MSEEKKIKKVTNEIFVGNKPFMKYVLASIILLKEEKNESISIKARGKFISRAVDIAEVVKKKLKEDNLSLKEDIKINTEEFKNEAEKKINVSIIEIKLTKK